MTKKKTHTHTQVFVKTLWQRVYIKIVFSLVFFLRKKYDEEKNTHTHTQVFVKTLWQRVYIKIVFSLVLGIIVLMSFVSAHVLDRPLKFYYRFCTEYIYSSIYVFSTHAYVVLYVGLLLSMYTSWIDPSSSTTGSALNTYIAPAAFVLLYWYNILCPPDAVQTG